jgi:phosphoglycerol geranylgeranyltransferase
LAFEKVAGELEGEVTSADELETALDDRELPGEVELDSVLDAGAESFPRELVFGLLVDRLDLDTERLPVEHISVA